MDQELTGGCLCGAVRYRVSDVKRAGYCHCRMCQKASGAPVVGWLMVSAGALVITSGTVKTYRSSASAERDFCPACGSQLVFRSLDAPREVDINLATLDHPERITPQYHIHTSSQMPWLHIEDTLPRHPGDRPTS